MKQSWLAKMALFLAVSLVLVACEWPPTPPGMNTTSGVDYSKPAEH